MPQPPSPTDAPAPDPAQTLYRHIGKPPAAWTADDIVSFVRDRRIRVLSRCSGRLTLVALIRAPDVIGRILRHLHLPDAIPVMRPARDPPVPLDGFDEPQYRADE